MEGILLKYNIFFESGSTYAYLAQDYVDALRNLPQTDSLPQTVFTNNILVYMLLIFQDKCIVRLYPGTPANKYGATFGNFAREDNVDKFEMEHFLNGNARREVANAISASEQSPPNPVDIEQSYRVQLILMAVSRL